MTARDKLESLIENSISSYIDIDPGIRKSICEDAVISFAVYLRDISNVDLDTLLDKRQPEEIA
jgi:hypothetical protein